MLKKQQLLTRQEVGEMLQVSRSTLERWDSDGTLPTVKIGRLVRYRPEDIEAFIQAGAA